VFREAGLSDAVAVRLMDRFLFSLQVQTVHACSY
jgi:hypothetical protein